MYNLWNYIGSLKYNQNMRSSANFSANVEDILNEDSSSGEDPVIYSSQGKRYNQTAENEKIRRMLMQEEKAKKNQLYQNENIDFDQLERELESKYGKGAKRDPLKSEHTYTREQLLQDSSDGESSSDSSPVPRTKPVSKAQPTIKPAKVPAKPVASAPPAQQKSKELDERQKMLNELMSPDSDDSDSEEERKRAGSNLKKNQKEEINNLVGKENKGEKKTESKNKKTSDERDDKSISIANLGFDIDKALLEQNTLELQGTSSKLDAPLESQEEAVLIREEDHLKLLQIIQNNEKNNEAIPEKVLQQANQLLSFDNRFYNVKNNLIVFEEYPQLSKKLYLREHPLYGVVQCIKMLKNYLFVGNSKGIIRVFDLKSQQEMMPLKDPTNLGQHRVTSMDIHEGANLLICGFQNGDIALWDLEKYSLLKHVPNLHESAITNIKFGYRCTTTAVYSVSCEDAGPIIALDLQRRPIFGGYSSQSEILFKERIEGPSAIAVFKPDSMYPHAFCDESLPAAFGGINNISIITLLPVSGLHTINKPKFSKVQCIPYMDWGFGLTPSHREKTVPILAFAWDRLIQLVYVNEEGTALEVDGFFYSDREIISLYFVAESVLLALFENKDGREVKLLYTPKFYPGSFKQLELAEKNGNWEQFERVSSVTEHAVLEKKFGDVQNLFFQVHNKSMNNFTNSVHYQKQNVVFLGTKGIQRARIFSWKEYIDFIREKHDWLAVLKVALEIYNGDLKGLAKVADEKEMREAQMKSYLKELLKSSIENVIYKFQQKNSSGGGSLASKMTEGSIGTDYRADEIAIKVSIEFCLSISATDFLFAEMFTLFHQFNMRAKLIANLEPFLISGQFKKGVIPEDVLTEFLRYYEQKDGEHTNQRNLERIVQQIDLMQYSVGMRAGLEVFCEQNCMISALLHLQKTSGSEKKGGDSDIISTMYKILKNLRKNEKKSFEKGTANPFMKSDILILNIVDSQKKYEIEKSYCYIGYKLLWIIKMYLDGRQFPYGSSLTQEQWKRNTLRIAEYIVNKEFITDMLEFDAGCFLEVIQKLFYGEPYWFIDRVKTQSETGQSYGPLTLLAKLQEFIESHAISQEAKMKEGGLIVSQDSPVISSFYNFILNIHVEHQKYQAKMKNDALTKKSAVQAKHPGRSLGSNLNDWSTVNSLQIEPELIFRSIQKTIERIGNTLSLPRTDLDPAEIASNQTLRDTEQRLIEAIVDFKSITRDQIQTLHELADAFAESREELNVLFLRLRIYLLERQDNFLASFKLNLLDPELKAGLFEWINHKFQQLDRQIDADEKLNELRTAVAGQMKELIESNDEKTVQLIERWFDDSYSDQLIVKELSQYPIQQFNFLMKYLHFNEMSIKITIHEGVRESLTSAQTALTEKQEQSEKYTQYLCLFVELMCSINKTNPELVDESLIEAYVKKDYYPTEACKEICLKHQQDRALAVLLERDGDLSGAIATNMNHLKKMSLIKLCSELLEIIKFHSIQWQARNAKKKSRGSEETRQKEPVESLIRNYGDRWDFEECYKYKQLNNFDATIQRAVDLAKRAYEKDGEGVFFTILLTLGDWSQVIQARLKDESKTNKQAYDKLVTNSLDLKHEQLGALLEDFITKRKNAILMKHVPYNISPETLLAKLNLDLRSIRKVFDYRVKAIKGEKKLIKMANELIVKELLEQYFERENLEQRGYILEGDPELRRLYMPERLISKDVCDSCDHDILSSVGSNSAMSVFIGCGHTFHKHCVNIYYRETEADKDVKHMRCPKCAKEGTNLSLEQLLEPPRNLKGARSVRRSTAAHSSVMEARDSTYQDETENKSNEESGQISSTLDYSGYRLPGDSPLDTSSSGHDVSESLLHMRLDQFDRMTAMGSLTSDDFGQ